MKVSNYDQRCPPAFIRHGRCEYCWHDAIYMAMATRGDVEVWYPIMLQRNIIHSPQQQAGQFWNEELQIDERWLL